MRNYGRLLSAVVVILLFVYSCANVCPDKSSCESTQTCCQLSDKSYGCCTYEQGVCCPDKAHCCPKNFRCDLTHARCVPNDDNSIAQEISWNVKTSKNEHFNRLMNMFYSGKPADKQCDGCKDGSTCCNGNGCCPFSNAICCSDGQHCCPENTLCDASGQTCMAKTNLPSGILVTESASEKLSTIKSFSGRSAYLNLSKPALGGVCPGGKAKCADDNTCCQLPSGEYGCCPYPKATCCSDKQHCCPQGYKCDLPHSRCIQGEDIVPLKSTMPGMSLNDHDVVCPGGKDKCPDESTCCQLPSGDYGCCPHPNATCCSDKQHCCPHAFKCDVSHSRCVKDEIQFDLTPVLRSERRKVEDVVCPGGKDKCPDESTCCQLPSGDYGCCPHPNATCCSDKLHCCPHAFKCDVSHSRCVKDEIQFDLTPVLRSERRKVEDVVCPDGRSKCPDGATCCQLASGRYGCCPYPNADCCSDHQHCCPQGTTCDLELKKCVQGLQGEFTIDYGLVFPAVDAITDVVCPGGKAKCPDGTTCCELSTGEYGCCPYPKGVCCSDKLHCCPTGTRCDIKHQQCVKGIWTIHFAKTLEAIPIKPEAVVCPGGQYKCPDETTCCLLESGEYGCCPYPKAVCCTDKEHCCPEGTQCDLEHSRCVQGSFSFSFAKTLKAEVNWLVKNSYRLNF